MTQVVQFVNLEGKRPSLMGAVGLIFLAHSHGEQGEQCHQFASPCFRSAQSTSKYNEIPVGGRREGQTSMEPS